MVPQLEIVQAISSLPLSFDKSVGTVREEKRIHVGEHLFPLATLDKGIYRAVNTERDLRARNGKVVLAKMARGPVVKDARHPVRSFSNRGNYLPIEEDRTRL